ncbi:hypothetical protein IJ118_01840 [Candidatus Saccharibacteria bacterium]|nr:hypothetical protein [Candidatus Saccharibacteria bacterium]
MATTKEIINFKTQFEDIDENAWPANRKQNNEPLSRATIERIEEFRLRQFRKLGKAAIGKLDIDNIRLAA